MCFRQEKTPNDLAAGLLVQDRQLSDREQALQREKQSQQESVRFLTRVLGPQKGSPFPVYFREI